MGTDGNGDRGDAHRPATSIQELASLLRRERDALEMVLQRLVEGDQPDLLFRSISSLELHRAITVREVAVELGVDGEPTLAQLIRAAPPEWAPVLAGHARALRRLASEVDQHTRHRPARVVVDVTEDAVALIGRNTGLQRSLRDFLR